MIEIRPCPIIRKPLQSGDGYGAHKGAWAEKENIISLNIRRKEIFHGNEITYYVVQMKYGISSEGNNIMYFIHSKWFCLKGIIYFVPMKLFQVKKMYYVI